MAANQQAAAERFEVGFLELDEAAHTLLVVARGIESTLARANEGGQAAAALRLTATELKARAGWLEKLCLELLWEAVDKDPSAPSATSPAPGSPAGSS